MEVNRANYSFLHGRSVGTTKERLVTEMHYYLTVYMKSIFQGMRIEICANRASIMSNSQYIAYFTQFGVRRAIKPAGDRSVGGIGCKKREMGVETIQIPLVDLLIIIDVHFLLFVEELPTLLSMKYMLQNGLYISLQDSQISFARRKQELKLENCFIIHQWKPSDTPHFMYTEGELRSIHRSFLNPSIK